MKYLAAGAWLGLALAHVVGDLVDWPVGAWPWAWAAFALALATVEELCRAKGAA